MRMKINQNYLRKILKKLNSDSDYWFKKFNNITYY